MTATYNTACVFCSLENTSICYKIHAILSKRLRTTLYIDQFVSYEQRTYVINIQVLDIKWLKIVH